MSSLTFDVVDRDTSVPFARTGILKWGDKAVETPCFMLNSRRGLPLNLTPDNVVRLVEEAGSNVIFQLSGAQL